jgi:hypothetical protein
MQTDEELQALKLQVEEEVNRLWNDELGGSAATASDEAAVPPALSGGAGAARGLLASAPMQPVPFFQERLKPKLGQVTSELVRRLLRPFWRPF